MNILPKLAFFMVRFNGLQYLQEILDYISKLFTIKGVFGIKWKEEDTLPNLETLYSHKINDDAAFQDIIKRNNNILVGIISVDYNSKYATPDTHSDNMNTVDVKRYFRNKYGNIMHISDTEKLAYKEIYATLGLRKDHIERIINLKKQRIGQYCSHHELIKTFNKIEDGRVTLWKPIK